MKKWVYIIAFVLASSAAVAAEPADTIVPSIELDEVVVEGVNQRAKAGELSFIPTKRQKEVAQGGYDLLRRLAMPQISVDPTKNNVTTLTGDGVAIYINGIPASENETKALKTSDVLKVQYLESPVDPRYDGKKHVINFTVKQLDRGGYTRASLEYNTSAFEDNGVYADVYSKFAYKRMIYDLYVGHNTGKGSHNYSNVSEQLSLKSPQGEPYWLTKTETVTSQTCRIWTLPITFRAIYSANNIQISNTLSFFYRQTPENSYRGIMQLSTAPDNDYDFANSEYEMYRGYGWEGFYTFNFGKGVQLLVVPLLAHQHSNSNKLYTTNVPNQNEIKTDSRENAWNVYLKTRLVKEFSEQHSAYLGYWTTNRFVETVYEGTSVGDNDIKDLSMGANIGYNASFPFNLRLNADAGFSHNKAIVNNAKNIKITPTADIDASYVPNDQHQINLALSYKAISPAEALKTSTVVQRDEWMYFTGSPDLKPYNSFRGQLYYTWLPSNKFYATAVFENYSEFNSISQVYAHYNNGQALLRSYISDGDYYSWTLGLNLTYKPISKLQLECNAAYKPAKRTGINTVSVHPIEGMLSATYYMGNFYVNAFGMLIGDKILPLECAVLHDISAYGISAGWGNGHWTVKLYAQMMFKDSWKSGDYSVTQPLYTKNQINYDFSRHRLISVNISYTFDYGKKVQHGNEVTQPTQGSSSILK